MAGFLYFCRSSKGIFFITITKVFYEVYFCFYLCFCNRAECSESPEAKQQKIRKQVWEFAKEKVKGRLVSPSSAKFTDLADKNSDAAFVGDIGPTVYVVRGVVESSNKFGVMIPANFLVTMGYDTLTAKVLYDETNSVLIDGK